MVEPKTETSPFENLSAALMKIEESGLPAELAPVLSEALREVEALRLEHRRLQEELDAVNREKGKFVSVVTHELRIPMTSIKGYTDLLRSGAAGAISEQQNSFLRVIRNNVDRMSALVSDLADLAHMESGRLKLNITSFSISGLIDELCMTFKPRFKEKDQTFTINLPLALPEAHADRIRTAQVLTSLLNNALKYTPEKGVVALNVSAEGEMLHIEVVDNGAGILESDQKYVFTQFFRSEDPVIREEPGWGLNLCVANKLVKMMRGEIGFHSRHREGSTFWFSIPVAKED